MKNSKKALALLLTLMLAASMVSCGNSSDNSSTGSSTGSTAEGESSTAGGEPASTEITLPLADGESLSYFISLDANASIVVDDYNDNEFFQALEEKTGVHIDWMMNSSSDFVTNFNLMIASNQIPDMVYGVANYYSDGLDASIDDGYFMDLTDKVAEYMPNYQSLRLANPEVEINTKTDSGRLACVYAVYTEEQGPWYGMQMRKDWLDELGMEVPTTFDEWEAALTGFKDQLGAYAPLSLTFNGFDAMNGSMSAGYGVWATWQLDETGKVNWGPSMDGWREYLTKMNDWFEKGLIDPDFMAQDAFMVDMTSVITGKTGAWTSMYTMPSLYEASSEDTDMYIIPVTSPVVNEGDELHIRYRNVSSGVTTSISADCSNWELAMRWLDYLFSEEGGMLANYGVEGDTYTLGDDGTPVFTDKVLANVTYSFSQAQANFLMPPSSVACLYDWTRELAAVPEKDIESYDVWSSAGQDWTLPTLSLTQEESVERAAIMTDIETYAKENSTQFITGVLDIETGWDEYVSTIQGMNLARAIEITQAAYDRYLER